MTFSPRMRTKLAIKVMFDNAYRYAIISLTDNFVHLTAGADLTATLAVVFCKGMDARQNCAVN